MKISSPVKTALLILNLFPFIKAITQPEPDVTHYKFQITVNDKNDSIYGLAVIHFIKKAGALQLDLAGTRPDKKGMLVTAVYSDESLTNKLKYRHSDEKLIIDLPAALTDTAHVFVSYKGIPFDGLIISKNKYGQRTFFADNWPNRGHNWLPCHDVPGDKASVEFVVTAPAHYQVISNGIQVEETNIDRHNKRTHWREEIPIPTKVMVIGVAEFAVQQSGLINGCIPVTSWVYPADRDKGFYDYALAAEILPFYIKNIGPYPYKKLANVESKTMFGGMENANAIFYSENSITGQRKREDLIAHEIAHQWFGNMATEKSFAHVWLSEGFATYLTILYMENKYGKDTAIHMLREDRAQVIAFAKRSDASVVDHNPDYMELLNANSYQKGGWVLHMLHSQVGDEKFWEIMRKYFSTYAGKNADSEDFQKIVEEVTGRDWMIFFKQWLYTPGVPQLNVDWKYDAKSKSITINVKQVKNISQFPLQIGIRSANGQMTISDLFISKEKESFRITVKEKPVSIVPDPNTVMLFDGKVLELK